MRRRYSRSLRFGDLVDGCRCFEQFAEFEPAAERGRCVCGPVPQHAGDRRFIATYAKCHAVEGGRGVVHVATMSAAERRHHLLLGVSACTISDGGEVAHDDALALGFDPSMLAHGLECLGDPGWGANGP